MGWWSATIMGGDSPMDIEVDVQRLLGLYTDGMEDYPDWEEDPARTRAALEAVSLDQWQAFIAKQWDDEHYRDITCQVIAYMHITVGARLPQELSGLAIAASLREDLSGWRDPDERQAQLDHFVDQLTHYDGTPTPPAEEGLVAQQAAARKPRGP